MAIVVAEEGGSWRALRWEQPKVILPAAAAAVTAAA